MDPYRLWLMSCWFTSLMHFWGILERSGCSFHVRPLESVIPFESTSTADHVLRNPTRCSLFSSAAVHLLYLGSLVSLNGTDKFYLSLLGSLAVIYVIDVVLDSFSNLFRSHRYSPVEKLFSVFLSMASLPLLMKLPGPPQRFVLRRPPPTPQPMRWGGASRVHLQFYTSQR